MLSTIRTSRWRTLLGVLIGGLLVGAACWGLSWRGLAGVVGQADPGLLLAAVASVVVATWIRAWRWKLLFYPSHVGLRVTRLWSILLVGQALNIVVPARLGEVARVYLLETDGRRSKSDIAASVVLEKLFDAFAFATILVLTSTMVMLPPSLGRGRDKAVMMVGVLAALTIAVAWGHEYVLACMRRIPAIRIGARTLDLPAFTARAMERLTVMRSWPAFWRAHTISVLVWLVAGSANYFVIRALGLSIPPAAALVVLIVLQLGTAVPVTPGHIGVFEYLVMSTLALYGVPREAALGCGLLLHVIAYLPPVLAGSALMPFLFRVQRHQDRARVRGLDRITLFP